METFAWALSLSSLILQGHMCYVYLQCCNLDESTCAVIVI